MTTTTKTQSQSEQRAQRRRVLRRLRLALRVVTFGLAVGIAVLLLALCEAAHGQQRVLVKEARATEEQREVYKCERPQCDERGDRCTVRCFVDITTSWACDDDGAILVTTPDERRLCQVPESDANASTATPR